jgi:hypothetical protein
MGGAGPLWLRRPRPSTSYAVLRSRYAEGRTKSGTRQPSLAVAELLRCTKAPTRRSIDAGQWAYFLHDGRWSRGELRGKEAL